LISASAGSAGLLARLGQDERPTYGGDAEAAGVLREAAIGAKAVHVIESGEVEVFEGGTFRRIGSDGESFRRDRATAGLAAHRDGPGGA
jgi:hypothetical protein